MCSHLVFVLLDIMDKPETSAVQFNSPYVALLFVKVSHILRETFSGFIQILWLHHKIPQINFLVAPCRLLKKVLKKKKKYNILGKMSILTAFMHPNQENWG